MPARPTLDPQRRAALLAAKLRALGRDHLRLTDGTPATLPGGAALHDSASRRGAVLVDENPVRGLGPALLWAARHQLDELHVLVDTAADAGVLARRAAQFLDPPSVWVVQGRDLHRVEPAALPRAAVPSPPSAELAGLLAEAGVDVVNEHGEWRGEVLGLEVAVLVAGPEGPPRLEVGVGRHDREAFAIVHGDVPPAEALGAVVAAVRQHRKAGETDHPLRRLAPERWLRAMVVDDPATVGAVALERCPGTERPSSVKDRLPAFAVGYTAAGDSLVVACSVGVDPDLVPAAADARVAVAPDAHLLLVVPERDALPATGALAARLRRPAQVVTVPDDWQSGWR